MILITIPYIQPSTFTEIVNLTTKIKENSNDLMIFAFSFLKTMKGCGKTSSVLVSALTSFKKKLEICSKRLKTKKKPKKSGKTKRESLIDWATTKFKLMISYFCVEKLTVSWSLEFIRMELFYHFILKAVNT